MNETPSWTGSASAGSPSPTRTPTSCCSASSPTGTRVWQALLDRGVLIRETGPPGWLRVTVGRPEEMTAFRHALDGALAEDQTALEVPR